MNNPTTTLSRKLLFTLAFCAGASVANLYYAQPLLAIIAGTFNAPTTVGWIAVATQVGYTLGIIFILPLGDLVDRRRLTLALVAVLVLATLACAMAPNLAALAAASVFVGVGATITQVMVPFAADLASPEQRGRAVGVIFSGILSGILLARTVSGALGEVFGWRPMFVIAGGMALVLGAMLASSLPKTAPKTTQRYTELLGSMLQLLGKYPALRTACVIQACQFAVFSAFWSTLALMLAKPPFELGSAAAGAFGILGLVGVVAANFSGRLLARFGTRASLSFGLACSLAAWIVFPADPSIRGLVIGIVLLDFGLSIVNVGNQSMILGLNPQATSRINTIYVTAIFLGGAVGSAAASFAWAHGGWNAVCGFGFAAALLAGVVHLVGAKANRTAAAPGAQS